MTDRTEWVIERDRLVRAVAELGFPAELGEQIAKQLGGTKAMRRMTSYLNQTKPRSGEEIVDEMLAICSDIAAWRKKKECEESNARYNVMLNSDWFGDD